MVTIKLSDQDIALINAAEHHRANCRKCSNPTTTHAREHICLLGLLHFSKVMRVLRMNPPQNVYPPHPLELETP